MEDSPGDVDELRTGLERKRKEGTEGRKKEEGRRWQKVGSSGMGVVTRGSCDGIFGNFSAIQGLILEFTVFCSCI